MIHDTFTFFFFFSRIGQCAWQRSISRWLLCYVPGYLESTKKKWTDCQTELPKLVVSFWTSNTFVSGQSTDDYNQTKDKETTASFAVSFSEEEEDEKSLNNKYFDNVCAFVRKAQVNMPAVHQTECPVPTVSPSLGKCNRFVACSPVCKRRRATTSMTTT